MMKPIVAAGFAAALAFTASAAQAQTAQPLSPGQQTHAKSDQAKPDKDSQTFIKNAIEGNNAEVDVGKLAQEKGQSDGVKQFGAMLVKDHGEANAKAKDVASKLQVEPPTGTGIGQKATYAKLKILSGATFDKSFAKAMVSDHQSDIKEYQKQAQKSDAAGAYAKESLPTLKKHLQEAQQLQAQLENKTSSNAKDKPSTTGSR